MSSWEDFHVSWHVENHLPRVMKKLDLAQLMFLDEVGELIKQRARHQATIDPRRITGRLWASIYSRRFSLTTVEVGATAYYGYFLEYGTSKMRPHPFIRPAYLAVKPMVVGLAYKRFHEIG
jgi:HK97 gp10 family phage protein